MKVKCLSHLIFYLFWAMYTPLLTTTVVYTQVQYRSETSHKHLNDFAVQFHSLLGLLFKESYFPLPKTRGK